MSSPDLSSVLGALTPAQQDAIRALIAQEAAKNAPPPPKVLTPAEQADLYIAQARAAFGGENTNFHVGQIVVIDRILTLLENLVKTVYTAAVEPAASSSTSDTSAPTVDATAPVVSETGAV